MQPDEASEEVSGWDDESLRHTAREFLGVGSDAELPDEVRFIGGVTRLIRKRLARARDTDSGPAVFLLLPSGPSSVSPSELREEPMLDNGVAPIGGALWFVGAVVARGLALEFATWPGDQAVFAMVKDELDAGDVPAIVLETRTPSPEARFYPADSTMPIPIRLSGYTADRSHLMSSSR